jgi:hypothetical protein
MPRNDSLLQLRMDDDGHSYEFRLPTCLNKHFPDPTRASNPCADFWKDALAQTLSQFGELGHAPPENRPTMPMFGGHGVLNLESRHRLDPAHFADVPLGVRAEVLLCLLARQGRHQGGQDDPDGSGKWIARQFRIASALFVERARINVGGVTLAGEVASHQRWKVVLAAVFLAIPAERRDADRLLRIWYGDAFDRLVQGGYGDAFDRLVQGDNLGFVSVADESQASGNDVSTVDRKREALRHALERDTERPVWLARLFLHCVCQRLHFTAGAYRAGNSGFFSQMRRWVGDADAASELYIGLSQLDWFGGRCPLDPGDGYPTLVRPYEGSAAVGWSDIHELIRALQPDLASVGPAPAWCAAVECAYLMAVKLVDRFIDPMQAQPSGSDRFFSAAAFRNVHTRMTERGTRLPDRLRRADPALAMMRTLFDHLGDPNDPTIGDIQHALTRARQSR